MKELAAKLRAKARVCGAGMYKVTDDYGTKQWAWTKAEALDWLLYCGPRAEVHNVWGRLVATRTQEEPSSEAADKGNNLRSREQPMSTKISNKQARGYVQELKPFTASNIFAEWITVKYREGEVERWMDRKVYAVFSYGRHWPLFVYDGQAEVWFENTERYSNTTSRHRSQAHPLRPTIACDVATIKEVLTVGVNAILLRGEAQVA
jgi:hypothetical protein